MILISHRGNINGSKPQFENHPDYIESALNQGYEVEVDIWLINDTWYLGHDQPQFYTNDKILNNDKIWFHAKNVQALDKMIDLKFKKFFWHDKDSFTLTSNGYIWTYPGETLTKNSICVLPESLISVSNIDFCYGVCSDYIKTFKDKE